MCRYRVESAELRRDFIAEERDHGWSCGGARGGYCCLRISMTIMGELHFGQTKVGCVGGF